MRRKIVEGGGYAKHTQHLRVRGPRCEAVLWDELRGGQILGCEFTRCYPIRHDRVDFYCEALRLAVEVDCIIRRDAGALRDAKKRDSRLARAGIRVLRFTDDEVTHNLDGVVSSIRRWIRSQPERWGSGVESRISVIPMGRAIASGAQAGQRTASRARR